MGFEIRILSHKKPFSFTCLLLLSIVILYKSIHNNGYKSFKIHKDELPDMASLVPLSLSNRVLTRLINKVDY